jgi:hypothetical protein
LVWRRVYYQTDSGESNSAISETITLGNTYYIELYYKIASGAGANDGVVQCWINGVSKVNLTNVDNDTLTFDRLRAGEWGNRVPTNGSILSVDDIKADTSQVGAYSEGASGVNVSADLEAAYGQMKAPEVLEGGHWIEHKTTKLIF